MQGEPEVLIVDDEELILDEYRELFEVEGIGCLVEADPLRALDVLLASPSVRLVITDLLMPGLRGDDLIRRAQVLLGGGRTVAFVLVSGFPDGNPEDLPGVKVLEKPVDPLGLVGVARGGLGYG